MTDLRERIEALPEYPIGDLGLANNWANHETLIARLRIALELLERAPLHGEYPELPEWLSACRALKAKCEGL